MHVSSLVEICSSERSIAAYEFQFSDVNPPVHAWAVFRVYKMTDPRGERDVPFLKSCFMKLILNFNWYIHVYI